MQIRKRYVLVGGDYSAQEPRVTAVLAHEKDMQTAFDNDRDVYSTIAAKAFHTSYENCLEHFPKDTPIYEHGGNWYYFTDKGNPCYHDFQPEKEDKFADGSTDTYHDGKLRRKQSKVILLGMLYGRGDKSLAEQLSCDLEEAKDIKRTVFSAFPNLVAFEQGNIEHVKKYGYVETLWGRKRRLPDVQLPDYGFTFPDATMTDYDKKKIEDYYTNKLNSVYGAFMKFIDVFEKRQSIMKDCNEKYGVKIKDNTGLIARAIRQATNARVQGSASDLTKKAIVAITSDERLMKLGFRIIVPIHDELINEVPLYNVKEAIPLFVYDMGTAGKEFIPGIIKVDPSVTYNWYGDEIDIDKELHHRGDDN